MCRRAAWSLPPEAASPAAARRAVRAELASVVLAGPRGEAVVQDVTLVVSELVSNAVAAGGQSIDLQLMIHHNHLVVRVRDDARARPRLAAPTPSAPSGRGLRLIDKLARAWTIQDNPVGKTAHVEISIPPGVIRSLPCDPSIT